MSTPITVQQQITNRSRIRAKSDRSRRRFRRGSAMIWFAIFVFVIFAFAALVADLGQAFVARRQMQSAVNTAALEGLRYRDNVPSDWLDGSSAWATGVLWPAVGDPPGTDSPEFVTWRENARRIAASSAAATVMPTYTRTTNGQTLTLTGGMQLPGTDFYASQTVVLDAATSVSLQMNPSNVASGDLVAGQFVTDSSIADTYQSLSPAAYHAEPQVESSDPYSRYDFTPASDATHSSTASSFLARLRRTGETFSDNLESSSGPTVPYFFGRAGIGGSADPTAFWNQRATGIKVRATAIADAVMALSVGAAISPTLPLPDEPTDLDKYGIVGAAPFAIYANSWSLLSAGTSSLATVASDGTISTPTGQIGFVTNGGQTSTMSAGMTLSSGTCAPTSFVGSMFAGSTSVGMLADSSGTSTWATIVPLIQKPVSGETSTTLYVVGFGLVTLSLPQNDTFSLTPKPSQVMQQNVSAAFIRRPDDGVNASELILHGKALTNRVLTPALVRSVSVAVPPSP
ncbi:MAG: pilus assembly protein [Planctomycetes bacterium]|nr:pilus assembly protein [Planctomycetota bacterium]